MRLAADAARTSGQPRDLADLFTVRLPGAGFAIRAGQIELATRVQEALRAKESILAEAGVGTGKTLAYLAAILTHDPDAGAVISTNTIALQEQIHRKELPKLRELGFRCESFLAKGKSQYMCKAKLASVADDSPMTDEEYCKLCAWAERGGYDRATISGISGKAWDEVALDYRVDCRDCWAIRDCGYARERSLWRQEGAIGITNHAQLLHAISAWSEGREGPFHMPGALVIDEAHQFPAMVQSYLTRRVGYQESLFLLETLGRLIKTYPSIKSDAMLLESLLTVVLQDINQMRSPVNLGEEESNRGKVRLEAGTLEAVAYAGDVAGGIAWDLEVFGYTGPALNLLQQLHEATAAIIEPDTVQWTESDGPGLSLAVLTRDPGDWLEETLFKLGIPVVFASATLSVGGNFSYFKSQLGDPAVQTVSVSGPFDYDRQVQVYSPEVPLPDFDWRTASVYYKRAFEETAAVIRESGGNALVLLTSRQALREAKRFFEGHPLAEEYPLLFQGDTGTQVVLEEFQTNQGSCLFGTAFWEGLDVVGNQLSAVIIPKLPYPTPDPTLDLECQRAEARGQKASWAVIHPRMMLRLKQGVGRLIRSEKDRGIVAILDPRFRKYRMRWKDVLPFHGEPSCLVCE